MRSTRWTNEVVRWGKACGEAAGARQLRGPGPALPGAGGQTRGGGSMCASPSLRTPPSSVINQLSERWLITAYAFLLRLLIILLLYSIYYGAAWVRGAKAARGPFM